MNYFLIRKSVKDFYENFAKEFSSTRTKPWNEVIYYYKLFKNNFIICDIGCGNGRHSYDLLKSKKVVIGVDISFNLIKIAHERFKKENFLFFSIVCDAIKLPLKENSVEGIISIATIHHIPNFYNRKKFVENCIKILNNKGIIIITAWNLLRLNHLFYSVIYFPLIITKKIAEFGDVYIKWGKKTKRYFHLFMLKELVKLFSVNPLKLLLKTSFGKGIIKPNHLIILMKIN